MITDHVALHLFPSHVALREWLDCPSLGKNKYELRAFSDDHVCIALQFMEKSTSTNQAGWDNMGLAALTIQQVWGHVWIG